MPKEKWSYVEAQIYRTEWETIQRTNFYKCFSPTHLNWERKGWEIFTLFSQLGTTDRSGRVDFGKNFYPPLASASSLRIPSSGSRASRASQRVPSESPGTEGEKTIISPPSFWVLGWDLCNKRQRHFLGGSVVKNLSCNAGDEGLIPGWGTKIPCASGQLSHVSQHKFQHSQINKYFLKRQINNRKMNRHLLTYPPHVNGRYWGGKWVNTQSGLNHQLKYYPQLKTKERCDEISCGEVTSVINKGKRGRHLYK